MFSTEVSYIQSTISLVPVAVPGGGGGGGDVEGRQVGGGEVGGEVVVGGGAPQDLSDIQKIGVWHGG